MRRELSADEQDAVGEVNAITDLLFNLAQMEQSPSMDVRSHPQGEIEELRDRLKRDIKKAIEDTGSANILRLMLEP